MMMDDILKDALQIVSLCVSGEEISKDLVQMLQRKLDDAVLDVLTVMLSRNPLCKLTSDDVKVSDSQHFPPVDSKALKFEGKYWCSLQGSVAKEGKIGRAFFPE